MSERDFVPLRTYSKMLEFNIVLDNTLIFGHLQILEGDRRFGGRIVGAKFRFQDFDESGPVIHPVFKLVGLQNGRFEIFHSETTKVREGKCDFGVVVGICGVVSEIKVALEYEAIELPSVGAVECIGLSSLRLGSPRCISTLEFLGHHHDCLSEIRSLIIGIMVVIGIMVGIVGVSGMVRTIVRIGGVAARRHRWVSRCSSVRII